MRIPQAFIDEVLRRSSIVQVIGQHVRLKKNGKEHSGLCPFHKEKTPSFSVNEERQLYYCHGCGAKGNLISFMTQYERYEYVDAVKRLAGQLGMSVPREHSDQHRPGPDTRGVYSLLEACSRWYQQQLAALGDDHAAVQYLRTRGVESKYREAFALGYAPTGVQALVRNVGGDAQDSSAQLREAGMIAARDEGQGGERAVFNHRIMFPIRDVRGRTVGFGGRALGERQKAKYLNSPETSVFSKRHQLYGLYEVLQGKHQPPYLLVVEGYMDALTCHQYGFDCAVASLGTAMGAEQLELAFRYTDKLIFCFDGDAAGQKAAVRLLEPAMHAMRDGREMLFLSMPENNDPDGLLRERGNDAMQGMLDAAKPLSTTLMEHLSRDLDLAHVDGRARLKAAACTYLNMLGPSAFKQLLVAELSERMKMNVADLEELLRNTNPAPVPAQDARASSARHGGGNYVPAGQAGQDARTHRGMPVNSLPMQMLSLLLYNPGLASRYGERMRDCIREWKSPDLATEPLLDIIGYLDKSPGSGLHDVLSRYEERYPEHPRAEKLMECVMAAAVDEPSRRNEICEEQMEELLEHMKELPARLAQRKEMDTALAKMPNTR